MKPELVIFDCDGVLVDSEPIANRVFAEALHALGLDLSYDEVCERFIGLSMAKCMQIIESMLGEAPPDGFVDRLQTRTFDAFRHDGLRPVEGVEAVIEGLDVPTCVASSGEHEKMRLTLGLTGLLTRFEGRIFSALDVNRGKPFPDLFLHAAREMGAEPGRCVVIEDSLPGVQAAIAAGMRVCGFASRGNHRELADAGARVFHAMTELPSLLS